MRGKRRCLKCGHETVYTGGGDQTYRMTPDKFRELFKVGDKLTAWSTDKPVIITAIGDNRVMFLDNKKERTASMRLPWRKADEQTTES